MHTDQNVDSPFGAPEAGNLTTGKQQFYPQVEYSTMKTPVTFAADVTKEKVADARANFKLGFHFYDKENQQRQAIEKFSFVVLEVYSGVSGSRETHAGSGQWISYFSNYVKNSQKEPFAFFEKGQKRPIATGFYQGKKTDSDFSKLISASGEVFRIPEGAGFQQHFLVYWIEGDRVMDLKLTTMVSREIKEAIASAEATAGRRVKADRVNLFSLADGGAFWGFQMVSFRRANKDGSDYDRKGEMYLVPTLQSGVVKTEGAGANPVLWDVCKSYQDQIRAEYEAEKTRRERFGLESASTSNDAPSSAPQNGNHNFPTAQPAAYSADLPTRNYTAPSNAVPVEIPTHPSDDLPF